MARQRTPADRPPRIAHLTTVDMSLALLLGPELSADLDAGFDVVGISAPGPYVEEVEQRGVRHVPVASLTRVWRPTDDLRAGRALLDLFRRLDLDILHTHTPKAGVLGRMLGRVAGVPVVVNTCHGLWAQRGDPLPKQAVVLAIETVVGWFSHAELYQNDEDRRRLRLVRTVKQRTVGNGVDLARFRPHDEAGRKVRAELGVADDELLVGGVGRRVAEKGIAEFAHAARALADRAHFVWVGPDGGDRPDRLFEPEEGVRFLDFRDDMPAVYAALDVFALPSYREGFSRSAMEAAACGCAIVVSDIRGCREIGVHEREVLHVPPADAPALTAALTRLFDESDLRRRLAEAAKQRAKVAFDQQAVARASLETYRQVARRKGLAWADKKPVS